MFLLLLSLLTQRHVLGSRWILFGGYTGFEGQPGTQPSDTVELLGINQEDQYQDPNTWCSASLASLPLELEGSTVVWVGTRKFSQLGNSSYSTAHHTTHFNGALLCGGADRQEN